MPRPLSVLDRRSYRSTTADEDDTPTADAEMRRSIASTIWRSRRWRMAPRDHRSGMTFPPPGVGRSGEPASRRPRRRAQLKPGVAARLSRSRNPQPSAGRQLRLGDPDSTSTLLADARRLGAAPGIRAGLHYTGPRLQGMAANRPEAIGQIRHPRARQVEIVGGGYYEPILVTLRTGDRNGQLVRMARQRWRSCSGDGRPGMLAERVWEPSLAYDLRPPGTRWPVLDDNTPRRLDRETRLGDRLTPTTAAAGSRSSGTEQGLRYRIPFKPVEDSSRTSAKRTNAGTAGCGMMGDDGESSARGLAIRYCWQHEHLGGSALRGLEREPAALDRDTVGVAQARHDDAGLLPHCLVRGDDEWVLPPKRRRFSRRCLERARERGLPRRVPAGRASGATTRPATARSTTSTSRCFAPPKRSTRCPTDRRCRARSTTCTRASRTTATGTGSSAGSTSSTCAWRRCRT